MSANARDLLLVLLAVLLVLGWYLSYTAARLDRLHAKVSAARTALDVQLLRRRTATIEAARYLDPASALLVTDAASQALSAAESDESGEGYESYPADVADSAPGAGTARDPLDLPPWLEPVENDLSRALHLVYGQSPSGVDGPGGPEGSGDTGPAVDTASGADGGSTVDGADAFAAEARDQLARACRRVQLARRFYNDAVAQTRRVRDKRVVRWAHLAGRAPEPQMVELDDSLPPGLDGLPGVSNRSAT